MLEYYTVVEFSTPESGPIYLVDGPDICPHCLAVRLPAVVTVGSAAVKRTPSAVMISTASDITKAFPDAGEKLEEAFAAAAQKLVAGFAAPGDGLLN